MVTTFIEFSDQLVIIQDNQNAAIKLQIIQYFHQMVPAIQITRSSQLQTQFSQRDLKIS